MTSKLANQTVLITGASSGLGEQIAYRAAEKGAQVILCARNEKALKRVSERCSSFCKIPAEYFILDVSEPDNIETVLDEILSRHKKIDVLVNNAGFGLFKDFITFDMSVVEEMFRVNVLGLMYITQRVALNMAKFGSGHIVNIASQGGKMATPKSSVYSATKFAVLGFSNALRLELKSLNIHVTTVNPGPIKTTFFDKADESGDYLENIGKLALDPVVLSEKIVKCFGTNKREINTPYIMEIASVMYSVFPKVSDILALTLFNKK